MTGRFFEDFEAGQRFESGTYTLEEGDLVGFAKLYDPQPFHTDPVAAERSVFRGLAASGWHTTAITMRLVVDGSLRIAGGIVGRAVEGIEWPRPVRPGDTLRVVTEILEVRPSASRPDRGTVRVRHTTLNQRGEPVQVMVGALLVPRRASAGAA
jgi:acyl dehydratase